MRIFSRNLEESFPSLPLRCTLEKENSLGHHPIDLHSQEISKYSSIQPMFIAARRGLASIPKSVYSPSIRAICIETPSTRPYLPHLSRSLAVSPIRTFSVLPLNRQRAAAAAAVADEIADEVSAQQPPSDSQLDEATSHGPVTRFKELGERKMVCPTVVKTLVEDMKLETMTQVQSLTINETLKGGDVFVGHLASCFPLLMRL